MIEISPINFFKQYQSNINLKIIDIRPTNEYENYHIEGSVNIPYKLLIDKHNLFLSQSHTYYIICKNGSMSYHATKALTRMGYNAVNVIGGIDNFIGPVLTKFA